MKFVYQVSSGDDGFKSPEIPKRTVEGCLELRGWKQYLDILEQGWECWVYFTGCNSYLPGVYAVGFIYKIDYETAAVSLKLCEFNPNAPIKSPNVGHLMSDLVSSNNREIFALPDDFEKPLMCDRNSCRAKKCGSCNRFRLFGTVADGDWKPPSQLWKNLIKKSISIAYWLRSQSCVFKTSDIIEELSHRFYAFKEGDTAYAFPFALAIFKKLAEKGELEFDYVVPIPLSPDKAADNVFHRTKFLATELGYLLSVPVKEFCI